MNIYKKEWDSDFFGYPIGELKINNKKEIPTEEELKEKSKEYLLVYIFLPNDITIPYKSDGRLKLVDKKIIFKKKIPDSIEYIKRKYNAINVLGYNPELFYDLSLQSGIYSRFKNDDNFRNGEFQKLYKTWIKNSLTEEIADIVLSVLDDKDLPKGLVTIKSKEGNSNIGIIAVDNKYRGQGIGSLLLNSATQFAFEKKDKTISVATQMENRSACNFYRKNGFTIESITNIYHLWNL